MVENEKESLAKYVKPTSIREILKQHQDENLPVFEQAKLSIVVPAYRELGNGNIAQSLASLSSPNIPKNEVAIVYVINNPLSHILASKKLKDDPGIDRSELHDYLKYELNNRNLTNVATNVELSDVRYFDDKRLNRYLESVRENQIAYQILSLISESFNETPEQKQTKIKMIRRIWGEYSNTPLPLGFESAIRRNLQVAVVDNFSENKAAAWKDIGKQRREGITLSFEKITPNAKLVHPADADVFFSEDSVNYLLANADKGFDAIFLQQYSVIPTHPEQFTDDDNLLKKVMRLYFAALTKHMRNYSTVKYGPLGGSQIVVGRRAYKKHPYPSTTNEDFAFSSEIKADDTLKILISHQAENSIMLGLRAREESYDGSSVDKPRESILEELKHQQRELESFVTSIVANYQVNMNFVDNYYKHLDEKTKASVLALYQANLDKFSKLVDRDRRVFRRQAKMAINLIIVFLQSHQSATELPLNIFDKHRRLREFFTQNPLLLSLVCSQVTELINDNPKANRDKISDMLYKEFLEKYFPEYFQPSTLSGMSPDKLVELADKNIRKNQPLNPKIKATDFIHILLANQAMETVFTSDQFTK